MQRLNLVSPPRPIVNVNEFRKISFKQDIIIGITMVKILKMHCSGYSYSGTITTIVRTLNRGDKESLLGVT